MRFRLRTLLILLALVPAMIGGIALRFISGNRFRKNHATRQMIYRLAGETEMEVIISHNLPKGGIRALVKLLNSSGGSPPSWFQDRQRNYPGIEHGIDAWGHELIVEIQDDSTVCFRSTGENGIDDHGSCDDIQYLIDCRRYITSQPAPE
jgi:hypothetical protein